MRPVGGRVVVEPAEERKAMERQTVVTAFSRREEGCVIQVVRGTAARKMAPNPGGRGGVSGVVVGGVWGNGVGWYRRGRSLGG